MRQGWKSTSGIKYLESIFEFGDYQQALLELEDFLADFRI